MKYRASYFKNGGGVNIEYFNTLDELNKYNEENNVKNHNLHEECFLSEIIKDGYVVCVEGDEDLEDIEISNYLKSLPKYMMLNNIYNEPQKLLNLKNLEVDVLIIQSTGVRRDEINQLQDWYISQNLPFPKAIVSLCVDAEDFMYKFIKASPFEIKQYHQAFFRDDEIEITRWIGCRR